MKIAKETEEKITQLQLIEQNLQNSILQKQVFQSQIVEIENALQELEKTKEAYKIVGPIMVVSDKEELKKDLLSKKEIFELRIKNLEKQEKNLKDKATELQQIITKEIKNE